MDLKSRKLVHFNASDLGRPAAARKLLHSNVYRPLLVAMFGSMMFCRFLCMMRCLDMVSTSNVSMMCGLFMRAFFMMFGRFNMVARGMLVVLGCFLMVFCTFVSSHVPVSFFCEIYLS